MKLSMNIILVDLKENIVLRKLIHSTAFCLQKKHSGHPEI